ncbi:MAG: YaaR family protein [Firmicutes bacterium]|jgi:uncharacterized protein YaaR (DUF327 family)|nr:YaaR family protein [Bacillota bacterium]
MKIGEKRTRDQFVKGRKNNHQQLSVVHSPFLNTLQEKSEPQVDLNTALENIDKLGKQLRDKPTIVNLKNYKAAVRAFLKEAISTAYTVAERRFVDRYGRRRLFLLVAKVDEQLEELTRMVLHQQHAALNLAAKLDEIRGLLLDINS